MADEVIRGLIDIRERASKKVRALRRELETLGGKTAVKTQREITKLERDIGKLGGSTAKATPKISRFTMGIAKGNLIAMAGAKAMRIFTDAISGLGKATLLAARVDVLNKVVKFTGQNAGYSAREITGLRDTIADLGISERHSLEIMQRFIQAELDLADAAKIARLAQDAGTIAGINSSEAAVQMTDAINQLRPRLLKTFGIMVDLNRVYRQASQELGKSVADLTSFERKQALLNATLEQGKTIVGVYDTAMKEAGKRFTSLPRHFETTAQSIGQHLTPVFGTGVDMLTEFLKVTTKISDLMAEPVEFDWLGDLREELQLLTPEMAANLGIMEEYERRMREVIPNMVTLPATELDNLAIALLNPIAGFGDLVVAGLAWANAALVGTEASRLQEIQFNRVAAAIDEVKQARLEESEAAAVAQAFTPPIPGMAITPEEYAHGWRVATDEIESDFAEYSSYVVGKSNETTRILVDNLQTGITGAEQLGDVGVGTGDAMAFSFEGAANSINSMINMMKSGTFTFGGFLQALAMMPGLGAFAAPLSVLGNILPFDDPVNDSALIRETRRIGTFLAKGFAQSAYKPQPSSATTINVTINAADMSPDDLFHQLARLQRTGFINTE